MWARHTFILEVFWNQGEFALEEYILQDREKSFCYSKNDLLPVAFQNYPVGMRNKKKAE